MSSSSSQVLAALLQTPKSNTRPELKVALTRLSLEVKERMERGSASSQEFFVEAVDALSRIKGTASADLRLSCLWNSGIFFHRTGFAPGAVASVRLMHGLATRGASKDWMRKANSLAGMVYGDIGDVAESIVGYANALGLALEMGDSEAEGVVLACLAGSFNYAGLHREAIRCAQRANATTAGRSGLHPLCGASYTNMAQAFLRLEDYESGFEAIQIALRLMPEVTDGPSAFSMCIREFTCVQLALELGKLELAREHSALCRTHSHWGNNPRCRVLADITSGLCDIEGGDVQRGFRYLESALAQSLDFALKIDALTALAKACDEVGRPEQALEHMKELLRTVRAAREKTIFALMSLPSGSISTPFTVSRDDMRALELRKSRLETKVAEREILHSRMEMLERLAVTADLKEESSGEHGYRVGRLAALLAADLGWDDDACAALDVAARLHDIGKIGVPDRILFNSQKLREAEREFISAHTTIGSELLAKSDIPLLRIAQAIALHHHEWWNGEGYPSKLRGKAIPIHARIVALADVFDALTHGRPYATPWSMEDALAEIRCRRGTQFDPELTDRFVALVEKLVREQTDLDDYLGKAGRNSPFLQARSKIRRLLADKHANEEKTAFQDSEIHA